MNRLLLCVILILTAAAIGITTKEVLLLKTRDIADMIGDLSLMRLKLKSDRKTLDELINYLSKCGKLSELWSEIGAEIANGKNTESAATIIKQRCILSDCCDYEIESYFSSFGSSDIASEVSKLDALISTLAKQQQEMNTNIVKKTKLALPLSILAGSAAALIIL